MRTSPKSVVIAALALSTGFAFALPSLDRPQAANGLPDWVTNGKPGTGPVFFVRGRVGSGEDANAGYAWLAELERHHLAWGGAVTGAQDVVFLIEAPDHEKLDGLLASSPWSSVAFTVEPLVRTKDRVARGGRAGDPAPRKLPRTDPYDPSEAPPPGWKPATPIAEPNHGDGTTHPAP